MIENKSKQVSCRYDILILGAGVVGLTMAAMLADLPLKIAILDQANVPDEGLPQPYDLRVAALNHASQKIFQSLGLWSAITELRSASYKHMEVWDKNSLANISFNCAEVAKPYLGHIVEQSVIRQVLWKFLQQQEAVSLLPQVQPIALKEQSTHLDVELSNHQILSAGLIIGADGANSWLAKQGELPIKAKSYQQTALVTTVRTELSHQHTARQRFLDEGPLAFLPLADEHLCSIVWTNSPENVAALQALPLEEFNQELTAALEYRLGKVEAIDQRLSFPLIGRHAQNYVKARIALVGDAAHSIHPLAGQGLNLGLLDAACLAEVVEQSLKRQADIGGLTTLRRYERWRKGENALMLAAMRGFRHWFDHHYEPIRHSRYFGFALAEKIPLLKPWLMQHALGLSGDLPQRVKSL